MFKKVYSTAKKLYDGTRKTAQWAVPASSRLSESDLEAKVDSIIRDNSEVRTAFMGNPDKGESLRRNLGYAVLDSYEDNHNLRRFASYIDTFDKSLVPIDAVADYTKVVGGIGFFLSTMKEGIEMIPKLAYMAYYTAKTKDLIGTVKDLAYEGLSFLIPCSILDLTNRYVKNAEKYVLKNAANKFLYNLGFKQSEKPLKDLVLQPRLQPT